MSEKSDENMGRTPSHDWMTPIDPSSPCGADLEYDPEYVVLFAQVAAKMDAQYGDFVGKPEPINWSEVDRDCRRLMTRSKDIRLAILFTRCRTRLDAATGLAEGLALLASWLTVFADTVHPQPDVDDDSDAALEIRMNALQALSHADGLLSDVRDIVLARSSATRLQVRDVERAFAQPRTGDALSVESVTRQLEDLRLHKFESMQGFDQALESLSVIDAWGTAHLGAFTPDLLALTRVLQRVVRERPPVTSAMSVPLSAYAVSEPEVGTSAPALHPVASERAACDTQVEIAGQPIGNRQAALQYIREARHWFENHEPSSPVPTLLRRAEQFVGKRYAEALKAIPPDLLDEWAKHD